MFLSTNTCNMRGECIKQCPTQAIRLINGKAFSCLTCGICYKTCPNDAIFINNYGGYVVDRAKCNGCGMCMHNCPTNNIHIEDGVVYGICSRCGVCSEICPSRVDSHKLEEDRHITFAQSMNITYGNIPPQKNRIHEVKRTYFGTDLDKCILCGRCSNYCPTNAIKVTLDRDEGICSECRVCSDVCPNNSINKKQIVNRKTCTLCLTCLKNCPHEAISISDFEIIINKINQKPLGEIVSCLNCGLCADLAGESLVYEDNHLRYDITKDTDNHREQIISCPVKTLHENPEMFVYDEFTDKEYATLSGFCVSCGKCVEVCDIINARQLFETTWDGKVSDDCISCGICSEVCPYDAITLERQSINVDLEKCILCENCAVHCPVDAIPKTTMYKAQIKDGFNLIDEKLCMHCGLCYKVCPYEAIDKVNGEFIVNDDKCIYCGACKNSCPANAFIFERNFKDSIEGV